MKVLLAVPQRENSIQELNFFLSQDKADLYIFPEGFLDSNTLQEAIDMIKEKGKYVITGFRGLTSNGQHREISAEELEAAGRKCVRVRVTDTGALAQVLDGLGLEYKIISDSQADIFGQVNVSQLVLALSERGCEVSSMHERDESLESYYVSLVGGEAHE